MQFKIPQDSTLAETAAAVRHLSTQVVGEISKSVVGLNHVVQQLLISLLAGGHVLMEGVPGTAKTTLCKNFARLLGIEFHRIQFTPDLLPSDVTGTYIFDRKRSEFVLRKGPIFCNILLADELNRAPAKTQSALLEAMQENQVTIEGTTLHLPQPFIVLATQNPIEQEGVYRLPEAQLDRFLLRVEVGYPPKDDEIEMLNLHSASIPASTPIASLDQINSVRRQVNNVYSSEEVQEYIVELSRASRVRDELALGASPRASLYLLHASRARAILLGRTFVTHEDVQSIARSVLSHRLILKPEAEIEGYRIDDIIDDLLNGLPVNPLPGTTAS